MKRYLFSLTVLLGLLTLVLPASAEVVLDDLESYADNTALNAVWFHAADVIAVTLENTIPGGAEGSNSVEADYWDRTVNWWGGAGRTFTPSLDLSGEKYISFYAWGNNNYQFQLKSNGGSVWQNVSVNGSGNNDYWQRYTFNLSDVSGGSGTLDPSDISGFQINIGPGGTANDRKTTGTRNYFDEIIATSEVYVDNAECYADSTETANVWTRNGDISSVGIASGTAYTGSQSIDITYTSSGNGYGGAGKKLPKLDITQETHLSFYSKGDGPRLYRMQIKSNDGTVWDTANMSIPSTVDWTLNEIDMTSFVPSTGTTDRTALSGISFFFYSPDGHFYIDDLKFTTPLSVENWTEY